MYAANGTTVRAKVIGNWVYNSPQQQRLKSLKCDAHFCFFLFSRFPISATSPFRPFPLSRFTFSNISPMFFNVCCVFRFSWQSEKPPLCVFHFKILLSTDRKKKKTRQDRPKVSMTSWAKLVTPQAAGPLLFIYFFLPFLAPTKPRVELKDDIFS